MMNKVFPAKTESLSDVIGFVEETLERMHLTQGQQDVLDCFMNGMSYRTIANYLDVATSTVLRRRNRIQMIYNSL